jgi:ParB-like chromosome segregation protein Spo0J
MDPEKFAEIKRSVHDSGQLVALTVRPSPKHDGRWEIICGHRRVDALRQLLDASADQHDVLAVTEEIPLKDCAPRAASVATHY